MKTAQEFQKQAYELGIHQWAIGKCSLCKQPLYYMFLRPTGVYFSSKCGCSWSPLDERSWQDVANHYNRQTHPDVIAEMNDFWRFSEQTKEPLIIKEQIRQYPLTPDESFPVKKQYDCTRCGAYILSHKDPGTWCENCQMDTFVEKKEE